MTRRFTGLLLAWLTAQIAPGGAVVHETVTSPIPDGVSQAVPGNPGNGRLAAFGFLDVTAAPYFADPTGRTNSTSAIQHAIEAARNAQWVCYFPPGEYAVSDALECVQGRYRRSNGNLSSARQFPCVLRGALHGPRPTIRLLPASPGFQDPAHPKHVIRFWTQSKDDPEQDQPNICFNQMLVGLNVVVGGGNPGAIAVRLRGAQGSGVQDCTLDVTHGLAGIEGGCGSGGLHAGVTVLGGRIGLDLRESQPAPTVAGAVLLGQTEHAILYAGRQSLCAVGLRIVTGARSAAIRGEVADGSPARGQVCLVDASIEYKRPAPLAVESEASLYLNNLSVYGAEHVAEELAGRTNGWSRVVELAAPAPSRSLWGHTYRYPVYRNGARAEDRLARTEIDAVAPPDWAARHLWPEAFPDFDSPGAVNVKDPPYGAKGDSRADDTAALQRAVDEHDTVFLPKGYYRLTSALRLKAHTRLIGVAPHLSILMARPSGQGGEASFPLVDTPDDPDADTVLAFCGLYAPREMPRVSALRWRCGARSILRSVAFMTLPGLNGFGGAQGEAVPRPMPLAEVTGHGAGRWYGFYQEDGGGQGPGYAHLSVHDTPGPLSIYQCNPEHSTGEANLLVTRASSVTIYGLKGELPRPPAPAAPIVVARDVTGLRVFGYGGNAAPAAGRAVIYLERVRPVALANLGDSPVRSQDPEVFHMVVDAAPDGRTIKTLVMDRPVLYQGE